MAGIVYWRTGARAWDTLVLGGKRWPGLAKVTVKGGQDIDVKKGKGVHGAQLSYQGYAPKDISITVRIWTAEQWDLLQTLIGDIEPNPTKKTLLPLDITHPVSKFRKVKSIAIKDIDGPAESSTRGVYELKITAIEFFPPKAAKKNTPSSSMMVQQMNNLGVDLFSSGRDLDDDARKRALEDRESAYAQEIKRNATTSPKLTEGDLSASDRIPPIY